MVDSIVSQNEDAKIYSIRTIGNDGNGSISAVVAGIEYAINQHVDIINLSLYANKTLATTVLEKEIQKAIDAGITVVGAAGNVERMLLIMFLVLYWMHGFLEQQTIMVTEKQFPIMEILLTIMQKQNIHQMLQQCFLDTYQNMELIHWIIQYF